MPGFIVMEAKSYFQTQKEFREWRADNPERKPGVLGISLQSNFTIEPLAAYIRSAAESENISTHFQIGGFNQYAQEFFEEDSPLHQYRPDIVFLIFGLATGASAAKIAGSLKSPVEAFRNRSGATLIISNFIAFDNPFRLEEDSESDQLAKANDDIRKLAAQNRNTYFFDLNALAADFGKRNVVNRKLHYLANIDFGPEFQEFLAKKCMTYARLMVKPAKKVLVLDLDDTLWGGIVGEVGENGISLNNSGPGSEFVSFQREILKLNEKGVLLAINSKNNPDDAMAVLKNHASMLLRPEHFACMKINWNDKAANMREIAAELNLGLDSLVFLDNSPIERGLVRSQTPEALTPELPDDPVDYAPFLRDLDVFEQTAQTEEDRNRAEMYRQNAERESFMRSAETIEDFIKSLEIKIAVAPVNEKTFSRACQLIMKTNQFNLTTRRHPEGAMDSFVRGADSEIFTLHATDIYGDSGITGIAILVYEKDKCRIDTLLLSCRILGRRIEDTFLYALAAVAEKRATKLIGEYIRTEKNMQIKDFYITHGFAPAGASGGAEQFELSLDEKAGGIRPCELHSLVLEGIAL
ncbi:MAG: HAD-IIIC family phosphatase [bacterium]